MIKSKYFGKTYENSWRVTDVNIYGRYGKRGQRKNTYEFTLTRQTSDKKCTRSIIINHTDMVALSRGLTTIRAIEAKQAKRSKGYANSAFYRFLEA